MSVPLRPTHCRFLPSTATPLTKTEMDEGFACPPEAGGGYYSSRANVEETKEDPASNLSGALPLRLKVFSEQCSRFSGVLMILHAGVM